MTLVYVRLTYQTLFLSLCKLLSSLFTLHLNLFLFLFFCFLFLFSEILAAFPLFVKKKKKNKHDDPKLLLKGATLKAGTFRHSAIRQIYTTQ